jgi:hypothetical protein
LPCSRVAEYRQPAQRREFSGPGDREVSGRVRRSDLLGGMALNTLIGQETEDCNESSAEYKDQKVRIVVSKYKGNATKYKVEHCDDPDGAELNGATLKMTAYLEKNNQAKAEHSDAAEVPANR